MSNRDPFSDESDPYPPEASSPAIVSRRTMTGVLLMLPVLAQALAGCAHVAPACRVRPGTESESRCQQRFCRNFRA
jgi:hypothetical protein